MCTTPVSSQQVPGPIVIDIAGEKLTSEDRDLIAHPLVGGVILFTRNYRNKVQLRELTEEIRTARNGPLLIATDHEGGRVQRFRQDFTLIPAMRRYGELYDRNALEGLDFVKATAVLMAWELRDCGLDFTFAPVADIDHGQSSVIGDRSFHSTATAVTLMGRAFVEGMKSAGCSSVIKHFPGHGSVTADTHTSLAVDHRSFDEIECTDLKPFTDLCDVAAAVMPAHVIYQAVDEHPASLSHIWQQKILREKLGFNGAIISDDLTMSAVTGIADQSQTAAKAIAAGTDVVLICNDRAAVQRAVDHTGIAVGNSQSIARRVSLMAKEVDPPDADSLARIAGQLNAFV